MGRKLSLALDSLQLHDADRASIDKRDFLYQPRIRTNYYPKGLYACRRVFGWLHPKGNPSDVRFYQAREHNRHAYDWLGKGKKAFSVNSL